MGRRQRDVLADHAPEGDAHEVEALEARRVGHPQGVGGQVGELEGARIVGGVADAAVVEGHHGMRRPQGAQLRPPHHGLSSLAPRELSPSP